VAGCFHLGSLAVDFTCEALRLLEAEPETAENAVKLKDDKAHVLLWLYICTLEKNLQTVSAILTCFSTHCMVFNCTLFAVMLVLLPTCTILSHQ